jgi:Na(+)-translocating NADH:ubiquinone oxidoreductase A subunit
MALVNARKSRQDAGATPALRGGYNVLFPGRPSKTIEVLPEPKTLDLPLTSRRFAFSDVLVKEGDRVAAGQILARDPDSFSLPLLAPLPGTVRLRGAENHIILENAGPVGDAGETPAVQTDALSADEKREKLVALGAWQFFSDAHTGDLPDPSRSPRAVFVSTVALDPFVARGDVQLRNRVTDFARGLENLQSLLEYQPIFLVMPDIHSALASEIREMTRGRAWVRRVEIPLRYGLDSPPVLARRLGLMHDPEQPVWALRTEGVFAIDRALSLSLPCTERIISVGGPAVESPVHARAMPGYSLKAILEERVTNGPVRVINGGALAGEAIGPDTLGLDVECTGLTVVPEHTDRELLTFVRAGWNRTSYSKCYLSSLRKPFAGRLTTGLLGERRACISCNACEEVCPARIMPHLIHKYLYQGALDLAERARVDLCVECGLCSFVCPSKIELRQQFVDAKLQLRREAKEAGEPPAVSE